MPHRLPRFMAELPSAPDHDPVRQALARTRDAEAAAALQRFASMPPATGVLANPVRHRHPVMCGGAPLELHIRSFGLRGCLLEEDIVTGAADAVRVIFVGLFGRFAQAHEHRSFGALLDREFSRAVARVLPDVATFMAAFPAAGADAAMPHVTARRKAEHALRAVNAVRPPALLLHDLIRVHLENVAVCGCASYMRHLLAGASAMDARVLRRRTRRFLQSIAGMDPLRRVYSLLLRRPTGPTEAGILEMLGAIQIHHGSAGSNMVARYFASLHTRSMADLFLASQMALDCARHFGAITDLTAFVAQMEGLSPRGRDALIRRRAVAGNLPAFGHPEIPAAGRSARIEIDPRPAIYLSPLFQAIDAGRLKLSEERAKRVAMVQRMYQMAFVEGIEKPGRDGRLRIAPNTDFGAWIVQEALGIEEMDRTLLSYVFRGFGWMMDVREQLQQPIMRPVIPPDPGIAPPPAGGDVIPSIVHAVHRRLEGPEAFNPAAAEFR